MAQAGWREEIDHAQEVTDYDIGGRDYPRIRYGEEQRGGGSLTVRLAFVAWDATGGRWAASWRESAGGDDSASNGD